MKPVIDILEKRITAAMIKAASRDDCAAMVRPSTDEKFGDYQANGVMTLAKKLNTNPRNLADDVVAALDIDDICQTPEIAGPGFINLRLKPEFLTEKLLEINADADNRLAVEKSKTPETVVVDFSGPNIAKQMHVGHLRSTIIGDSIARMLDFLGHNVIRQNHIGDWGTQFGMVILGLWHVCMAEKHAAESGESKYYVDIESEQLKTYSEDSEKLENLCQVTKDRHETDWRADSRDEEGDGEVIFHPYLETLREYDRDDIWRKILEAYQYVNLLEESVKGMGLTIPTRKAGDIPYESLSRHVTAMLQKRGPENKQEYKAWEFVTELTLEHCNDIYKMLKVTLKPKDVYGESKYDDMLPGVVEDLKKQKLASESQGAICIFPEGFKNKEGEPLPFIIQKTDGAYLYATTDLAAIRYRLKDLKAKRIIYVTDARQKLHFKMLFATTKMAGWADDNIKLEHVTFGSVLGEDSKPLKTRSGESVKLAELLAEAVNLARNVVETKNPDLAGTEKETIARAVGIGAVKYADYSNNRESDYIFSFDKMLAMEGNTAPYMQYAFARIKSIERKGAKKQVDIADELKELTSLNLTEPAELDLGKHLIRYCEAIKSAAADCRPNYLTTYLYELAQKFSAFYNNCPVLKADPDKRPTRLLLCRLTEKTIAHGLTKLLGIDVVEKM